MKQRALESLITSIEGALLYLFRTSNMKLGIWDLCDLCHIHFCLPAIILSLVLEKGGGCFQEIKMTTEDNN
jgi:hypothetical protein